MEKQLRHQRLNSGFSFQSILRKPRTISNVDNSSAVPYLAQTPWSEKRNVCWDDRKYFAWPGRMENLQREREVFAIPRRTVSDFLKLGERGSHRDSSSIRPFLPSLPLPSPQAPFQPRCSAAPLKPSYTSYLVFAASETYLTDTSRWPRRYGIRGVSKSSFRPSSLMDKSFQGQKLNVELVSNYFEVEYFR